MDIRVIGPINGHLTFTDMFYSNPSYFTNLGNDVLRASERLGQAIEDHFIPLVSHWKWRGNDERQYVLDTLRDRGAALVTAMAGTRDRNDLVVLLQSMQQLCTQQDEHIPWEFLYLGDPSVPAALGNFFGAHAVVGRDIDDTADTHTQRARPARLIKNKGPLAEVPRDLMFGYAEDNSLSSAKNGSENEIFTSLGIGIDKLVPLVKFKRESAERLSEFFAKSEVLTHFNCHTKPGTDESAGVLFVTDHYEIDEVKLDAIKACPNSIVVLNCCNGHTLQHSVKTTLAKLMVKKVQAVVAATSRIDDRYATRWAHHFYQALCDGLDVAQSILKARRQMLADPDPDPSALLYAYLGAPYATLCFEKHAA